MCEEGYQVADIHITRELLRAVTSGELPARMLTEVTWRHLMKLCPYCREEVEAFQRERVAPASYDTAFRVLPLVLQKQTEDLAAKMSAARRDLRDLLRLDPEARRARVRRANSRFRGVTLAALLLEEAKQHLPPDPEVVSDLASLAEQVLLRTVESPGLYDVFARAVAYRSNAQRAVGKLPEADSTIRDARGLMRSKGVTDPLVYAEVDWIEGALRKDQRKFEQAEELLVRAVNLYTLAGTPAQASQPLLTLGLLHYDRGEHDRAIEVTKAAAELISPEQDARSYLFARHNLALCLAESGQHRAANDLLEQDEELYRRFPDCWTSLRQTWLQGKIARGLGDRAIPAAMAGVHRMLKSAGWDLLSSCRGRPAPVHGFRSGSTAP